MRTYQRILLKSRKTLIVSNKNKNIPCEEMDDDEYDTTKIMRKLKLEGSF